MNDILVETWEAFKLTSDSVTQDDFKKKKIPPLYPHDQEMNHEDCLEADQTSNGWKVGEI